MKNCIYCNREFKPQRKDAKYCSNSCKSKYHRTKASEIESEFTEKVEENEVSQTVPKLGQQVESVPFMGQQNEELKAKQIQLENEIKQEQEKIEKLHHLRNAIPEQIEKIALEINDKKEEIFQQEETIKMDDLEFYNSILNKRYHKDLEHGFKYSLHRRSYISSFSSEYKEVQNMKQLIRDEISVTERFIERLMAKLKRLETDKNRYTELIKSIHTSVEHKNKRLIELDKRLFDEQKKIKITPPKPTPKQKGTIGAGDLLNMEFETFQLDGELGRFLGELDRNMTAFALTGDSGAGKSYFSFQLAKAFADYGMTVKYFSLEEGIGRLTQQKIVKYNIGNEIALSGEGDLKEVRRDAKLYDVVVVDSFSKLDAKAKDFEKLRNDFPKTIFIIIFQKTTSGAIRGGASIVFNSSATIDVHFKDDIRVATMKKGRYGTIGWVYDIEGDRILK